MKPSPPHLRALAAPLAALLATLLATPFPSFVLATPSSTPPPSASLSFSAASRRSPRFSLPADDVLQACLAEAVPCLRLVAEHAAAASGCGHRGALAFWLHDLFSPDRDLVLSDVEATYVRAGCSLEEAAEQTRVTVNMCRSAGSHEQWTSELAEWRLLDAAVSGLDDEVNAVEPMPDAGQVEAEGWVVVVEPVVVTVTAPVPADVPFSFVPAITASPAPDELRRRQATDDPPASSSSSSLACSTTRTVSTTTCPVQSTGTDKGLVLDCVPTTVLLARCAPGLLCSSTDKNVCMAARTSLDTGGLIVTISFSVALTVAVALLTFMCCRERAMHKRLAAKAEAAELAREAATQKKERPAVTEPLISGRGTGSRGGSRRGSFSGGQGGGYDAGNPFADGNRL